jgi:hypothetical protein
VYLHLDKKHKHINNKKPNKTFDGKFISQEFNLFLSNGNRGNGGNIDFRKKELWNDDFNNFFFVFLIMLLIFVLFRIKSVFFLGKKYNEIILKNCEIIPEYFLLCIFDFSLKNLINKKQISKIILVNNDWYIREHYIFSFIEQLSNNYTESLSQIYLLGHEPKVKNIKTNGKKKTGVSVISRSLKIKPGIHFNWCTRAWEEFCDNKIFLDANISTKLLKTKDSNIFLDIYIDFNERNSFIIKPGITVENNNFFGIISTEKNNIFGQGINFSSNISRNRFKDYYLSFEFKKFINPTSKIFIFIEKINQNFQEKIIKIIKISDKKIKNKIEMIFSKENQYKLSLQQNNQLISKVLFKYSQVKKIHNNLDISPYYFFTLSKNNVHLSLINFDIKLNFSSKIFFLKKNILSPKINIKSILKLHDCLSIENFVYKTKYFHKQRYSEHKNERNAPFSLYLNFESFTYKKLSFCFFIDIFKTLKNNEIIGKSIGLRLRIRDFIEISNLINSDGQIKTLIKIVQC